jgi:uncharacterized protein YigA (DUF484 family)
MTSSQAAKAKSALSEEDVSDFLRVTPDFFQRHEALLTQLQIQHEGRGAISLVERQIDLLRDRNQKLEGKLLSLIETARNNESVSLKLHRFSQALIGTESIEDVISTTHDQLRNEFKTERVNVGLFKDFTNEFASEISLKAVNESFPKLFKSRRPYSGILDWAQAELLFGDNAKRVSSAAIIPLNGTAPIGFLALGSENKDRFHYGMGILFLAQLGDLVGCALLHHQRLARS